MMNGVIIFNPAYKEKCYGHYCFFWTLEQLYHSFLRGCQKKIEGFKYMTFYRNYFNNSLFYRVH